ncbi:MAG: hypothetical protein HUU57_12445 [Bdellovibrio sp.]|nr:hypothetical protein [Bdellovibrio sp.]
MLARGLIFSLGFILISATTQAQSARWKITRTEWTEQDEQNFGQFITRLGESVEKRECTHVDKCLQSPANMYVGTDPANLRLFADCADLPYYLRGYFAWKNDLPFSFQNDVNPRQGGDNKDVRYTKFGNYVTGRYGLVPGRSGGFNAVEILNNSLVDSVWSASFRVLGVEEGAHFTDFYPVALSREAIRPGTVIYDPNGHVAIIYKVTDDGRIFYIDSHPDNTLTSGMYTPKFTRSFPYQGAGFKNFRPLRLENAARNSAGEFYGGRIVGVRNSQLRHFSLEQFYGNRPDPQGDWQKGQFFFRGVQFDYYEYLRLAVARGDLKIDPLNDMHQNVADICTSLKDRVVAVDVSIRAGIDRKAHPPRLPANIYGTDGEWEEYASPARDARLKVAFMDLLAQSRQLIKRQRAHDPGIIYNGGNLAADLLSVYENEARACQFAYRNSQGQSVPLNIETARTRLFDLSFDPYHCVELRWGASSAQELAACQGDENKMEWYRRERWLRYQWERRYDARMDFSLEELTGPKPGAGIAQPPDIDLIRYLNSEK